MAEPLSQGAAIWYEQARRLSAERDLTYQKAPELRPANEWEQIFQELSFVYHVTRATYENNGMNAVTYGVIFGSLSIAGDNLRHTRGTYGRNADPDVVNLVAGDTIAWAYDPLHQFLHPEARTRHFARNTQQDAEH